MQWHLPKRHLTGQKIYEKPVMWNKRNQRLDLKLTRFLFVERTDHIFWSAILVPGAKSIYSSGIIKALCSTKENKCLDTPTSERNLFLLHTHLQEQNCYKTKAQQNKRKLKDSCLPGKVGPGWEGGQDEDWRNSLESGFGFRVCQGKAVRTISTAWIKHFILIGISQRNDLGVYIQWSFWLSRIL